jgi:hypothetical protein
MSLIPYELINKIVMMSVPKYEYMEELNSMCMNWEDFSDEDYFTEYQISQEPYFIEWWNLAYLSWREDYNSPNRYGNSTLSYGFNVDSWFDWVNER